ncbi:MAG: tRNA pseudouridine(38-40) synthase TruA [Bacteroidota bacterium]|nr:tRNA pseudouridine(38-40) synthase TruA [Bacteroidota bacterium]
MQRYFIQLSYNGTAYHGWQIQENTFRTVQQVLNEMLSRLLNEPIVITGCGRTDTGVHATEYFAHFDSTIEDLEINQDKWIFKFNFALPADIAIQKIITVKEKSNARFDAISRTYQYIINKKKDPFQIDRSCFLYGALNIEEMNKATKILFDHIDFSAFAKTNTQNLSNNCKIYKAEWKEENDSLIFTISANRFLRNMVRAIVGTLLNVGKGKISIEEFNEIIESKTRSKAGFSAHACGLYLTKVEYPQNYFNV